MRELGLKVELIDLRDYFDKHNDLKSKLKELGAVFVSGGNVFVLRQAMRLSHLDEILKELREKNNFLYAGYSAAGCVLAPNLKAYEIVDTVQTPYKELKEAIWDGLGFIDFAFMPHWNSDHPESADIEREIEYCKENNIPYKAIRDGEVIIMENKTKPILITCYVNPDLDGVASAIAYGEFLQKTGKNAVVRIIGEPHDEAKYVLNRFGFAYPQTISNADDFDEVILVDTSNPNGLEGKIAPEKVIEIIDHRKVHDAGEFPNAKVQIELIGAAATLIAEKFMRNNIAISKESATLVYGAIISNTLNFKSGVTTDRDREAAAWLNKVAGLPEDFWRDLFTAKSDLSGGKLAERIESDFAWFVMGGKKVGVAQIEMIGAKELLDERSGEVVQILDRIKKDMNLDHIFQNTIELENAKNFFVAQDLDTQKLLEKVLSVRFAGVVAERPDLIMRKQIVPLLKEELDRE